METVAPPGIDALQRRVEMPPRIHESGPQQLGHLLPLLVGEARVHAVRLRILQVNLLVRHVHVAADDDGLFLVQRQQIAAEIVLPRHAVRQPPQPVLTVRRIDIHQIEVRHLQRDDAPLAVVLPDAHAVADAQRLQARIDGRPAVPLLLGIVPVRPVARKLQAELTLLQLRLLQTEEIGVQRLESLLEILTHNSPQAVHIPTDKLHIPSKFSAKLHKKIEVKQFLLGQFRGNL